MGELNVGPWSADHKLAMATILSDKVSEPVDGSSSRPQQYCDNLNRFFTEDDWAALSNPTFARQAKVGTVTARVYKLGMICPSQKLQKACAALVMA
eukprot:8529461-Pyramimonas_sp.AAC.1